MWLYPTVKKLKIRLLILTQYKHMTDSKTVRLMDGQRNYALCTIIMGSFFPTVQFYILD